jgi:Phosphatase
MAATIGTMTHISKLFQKIGLTGQLRHNSPRINAHAIDQCLSGVEYWTLGVTSPELRRFTKAEAASLVASSLGLTLHKFQKAKYARIDPDTTILRLEMAVLALREASRAGKTILFATGHPGSMLSAYQTMAGQVTAWGGRVFQLETIIPIESGLWLDSIGGCIVVTDEGTLHHTHNDRPLDAVLRSHQIDMVVADHGFAGAAINAHIPVVAFFDTDDPAIPLMASLSDTQVLAVPMNDNQKNLPTNQAITALLASYHD